MSTGTYVGVKFKPSTLEQLQILQDSLELERPVQRKDLHTTILYSPIEVRNQKPAGRVNWRSTGQLFSFEVWTSPSDTPCLVLVYDSIDLQNRHREWISMGGIHTYTTYKPHITLSYDISDWTNAEMNSVKGYVVGFDNYSHILIESEYMEQLDIGWSGNL